MLNNTIVEECMACPHSGFNDNDIMAAGNDYVTVLCPNCGLLIRFDYDEDTGELIDNNGSELTMGEYAYFSSLPLTNKN